MAWLWPVKKVDFQDSAKGASGVEQYRFSASRLPDIGFPSPQCEKGRIFHLLVWPTEVMNGRALQGQSMTHYLFSGFQQSPQQRRLVGARGGRACARNRRLRLGLTHPPPQPVGLVQPRETTAQAIAALDAQFPWLRGAQKRGPLPPGR